MELAEVTPDEYWADPAGTSIRAYEVLGMDGLISMLIPRTRDDYRIVTPDSYVKADRGASLEEAVAEVDAIVNARGGRFGPAGYECPLL